MERNRLFLFAAAFSLFLSTLPQGSHAQQKKKEIAMGPYFQTLRVDDSIENAIKRGQKLFNELGCAGCHPRGGTIGGTAVDVTGNRVPVPIPDLRGAALHYPRLSMTGFAANIGIMNDL
jgi:hypothetical protein